MCKDFAPRAAARHARARKIQLNVKGVEITGPYFGATSNFAMPRPTCAKLIALSVLCCLLAMARSDRQYGCSLRSKANAKRTERDEKINEESKKTSAHVHTGTWYFARYLVVLCVPTKAQGSAPQAADAARYAHAKKDATKTCRGGRKRPMVIYVKCELIMPRVACAELIALR